MAATFFQPASVSTGDHKDELLNGLEKSARTLKTLADGAGSNPAVVDCAKAMSDALLKTQNVVNNRESADDSKKAQHSPRPAFGN